MEEEIIQTVTIETEASQAAIDALTESIQAETDAIADLQTKISDGTAKRNEANKAVDESEKNIKQMTKEVDQNKDAIEENTDSVEDYKDEIAESAQGLNIFGVNIGQAGKALGGFINRVGSGVKSLGLFKVGLAGLGLAVFAGLLASVNLFLTNTKAGMDLAEQATSAWSASLDVVKDRLSTLGDELVKQSIQTANSESVTAKLVKAFVLANPVILAVAGNLLLLREAFRNVVDEIIEESAAAVALTRQLQGLRDEELELNEARATARFLIQELIIITRDQTVSFEERKKALLEAADIEEQRLLDEISLQTRVVINLEERQALGKDLFEDEKALSEARVKLTELETASLARQREILNRINELKTQQLNFETQINTARKAELEGVLDTQKKIAEGRENLNKKIGISELRVSRGVKKRIKDETKLILDVQKLREDAFAKQEAARLADAELQQQLAEDELALTAGLAGAISIAAKKGSLLAKFGGITEALINTSVAITKALPNLLLAATVGVLGGVQIAKIASVPVGASGGRIRGGNELAGFPRDGDNTLILAKPQEVILNEVQQARLGGAATFKRAGVPGFQGGGVVPSLTGFQPPLTEPSDINLKEIAALFPTQVLILDELNDAQNAVEIAEDRANV